MKRDKTMKMLIQNKGVAPTEAYTLIGSSGSRSNDGLIGQFGSGAKLAIVTLLRAGKKVTIYCGKTRMEFKTKTIIVNDGIEERREDRVYVQYGGTSKRKEDLGWTLGMGEMDWACDLNMALREFVANAIDRTNKEHQVESDAPNVRQAFLDRDLAVEVVPENWMRAQDGYTRVFIDSCDECQEYCDNLHLRFLHFGNTDLGKNIIPKVNPAKKKAQIYYNGVFVRELSNSADSLRDYNFTGSQIKIDESRNLDEYSARGAIGKLYKDASVDELVVLFTALGRGVACLETGLDSYYLKPNSWESGNEERRERWQAAWAEVNGDSVACGHDQGIVAEFARKKGYNYSVIEESAMLDVVKEFGIKSVGDVVSDHERKGRVITAPTFEAIDAVNQVWEWVIATDLVDTEKCKKPHVKGFDEITDAGSECWGFYKPGDDCIYIRNDCGGEYLLETALEEVTHYVTGAQDGSRDMQNFLMRLFIRWMR
jgi:hypothetical protein